MAKDTRIELPWVLRWKEGDKPQSFYYRTQREATLARRKAILQGANKLSFLIEYKPGVACTYSDWR